MWKSEYGVTSKAFLYVFIYYIRSTDKQKGFDNDE